MTTALYVPGTSEQDMSKVIMSAQLVAGQTATNTDAITTANTNIAAINASQASSSTFGLAKVDGTTITAAAGVLSTVNPLPGQLHNSLSGDVVMNSTSSFFDGPTVAQGTTGTWFASGTVTITDTASGQYIAKLWDGTTVIASARGSISTATASVAISLSGWLASPAANIKISVKPNVTTATMKFNVTGESKDSTLSVYRIA